MKKKCPQIRILVVVVLSFVTGCKEVDVTDPKVAAAISEVNAEFRSGYQRVLAEAGTRHFNVEPALAMKAMRQVVERMGFSVLTSEGDYYLSVTAPAPVPLDSTEWEEVRRVHEPKMKDIAASHLGVKGRLAKLEPDGLNILGIMTFVENAGGVDISITMRLQETKPQPPESILPRREYPPPTAVKIGYEKIWKAFAELALPLSKVAAAP
ncbi:MAG: hypothetical protein A3H91_10820 [Gammaproteobacteria bacterium RIFCSPLOWO2_02_FULL_61_13]|nr:MAG: hypothetical protein A3H91_10820 [Gammaproteobacteria bacterium RIFCSPLOWO2_02_FULL_61_13]